MTRFYDIAGWLCSSLGVALLVTSLVLVPENRALGESSTNLIVCSTQTCSTTCIGSHPQCGTGFCDNTQMCITLKCKCVLITINGLGSWCECSAR
jgi:hypothetical protein